MGRLENMKSEYDNIPIPKELNARIQKEIEKSEQRLAQEKKVLRLRRRSGLRKAPSASYLQRHLTQAQLSLRRRHSFLSLGHWREC